MMSSEEDTECFGLYDKLLINTTNSKKGLVVAGNSSLNISNSNSNSSSSSNISNNSSNNNKRNRQRVDAGEPRNSYSSIPNFSSRPSSFMSSASAGSGGLYGALLNQTQSAHFVGGLFGPNGFGSAKMLNELFGRQMKQAQDATSGLPTSLVDNAMLAAAMESATSADLLSASLNASLNSSKLLNNNCIANSGSGGNTSGAASVVNNNLNNNNNDSTSSNSSPALTAGNRRTSCSDRSDGGGATPPQQQTGCTQLQQQQQQNDLAHHMLRNILQGKKDLMALDQELRSVINQHNNSANLNSTGGGGGSDNAVSQDNNNCISKNKNNNSSATNNNNNNNGSSNRNLGNNCESRSTTAGLSSCGSNTKINNNTSISSANSNTNVKSSAGVLMNSLGGCGEVKIKSEPIAATTPINISNITNSVCIGSATSNNNNESSGRGSRNGTGRRKSSDGLSGNADVIICLGDGSRSDHHSEDNEDHDSSEMHPVQQRQQSDCQPTLAIGNVVTKKEADDLLEDELMVLNSRSDLESLGSPSNSDVNDVLLDNTKDELEEELEKDVAATANKSATGSQKPVLDMKRARVENIVSSMRSSPSSHHQPHLQVNGCKKRKLYQPQQHAMERYVAAAAGLNFGLNMQSLMLDEDEEDEMESPQIQQKRVEKNALKSQLRSMQEQLAEMQQKYVQLCSRMEQESECQEIDDTASDSIEQDDNPGDISPSLSLTDSTQMKTHQRATSTSPPLYPVKPNKHGGISSAVGHTPHMLTQMMSKMMTSKLHNPIVGHPHMQQTFNSPHPLLQHIPHAPADHPNSHMTHPAISNAAAMYLGQQFLLEQEARMAKEAAEQHERQQQQQQQQQQQEQQQQQQQHENQRRFEQEQQEAQQRQKEQQQQQQQQMQQQRQQQQQQHQQQQHQQQQHQQQQHQQQQQQQLQQHQQQQQLEARQLGVHASSANHPSASQSQRSQQQQQQSHTIPSIHSSIKSEISEKFNMLRSQSSSMVRMSGSDLEGLADVLKSEITTSLSALVDTIVTRFVHQRRLFNKQSQSVAAAAEQLNKDLLMASQILDRKSPRTKVADQSSSNSISAASASMVNTSMGNPTSSQSGNGLLLNSTKNQTMSTNSSLCNSSSTNSSNPSNSLLTNHLTNTNGNSSCNNLIGGPRMNGSNMAFASPAGMGMQMHHAAGMNGPQSQSDNSSSNNSLNIPPPHVRPLPSAAIFQAPKTPQGMNPVAAAALYNSMSALGGSGGGPHTNQMNPFCMPEPRDQNMEQNEALSLVVTPKKKRHKVTDTRITPRTVSRILAQDGVVGPSPNGPNSTLESNHGQNTSAQHNKFLSQTPVSSSSNISAAPTSTTPSQSPSPRSNQYHPPPPPPPMMPVSLPTSVAIPNPSLHESQVFSPYSPFFNPHHGPHGPHGGSHAPPTAAQMHHMKMSSSPPGLGGIMDTRDSPPLPHPPTMLHPALLAAAHHGNSPDYSAHLRAAMDAQDRNSDCNSAEMQFDGIQPTISFLKQQMIKSDSLTPLHSSTLTPMHLRKAKLMFFWVRYPSSAVLKMYFPDIKFNKNNTAQLVKWFSNFREFYYIQMEKYARQAVTEGVKSGDDLHVGGDSELYRVLNLHYNRNNHIEVPSNFRFVVEQTLREFFRAIQGGKDTEQSWKKSIYKIISRMDDPVPEYFKSPNFLEQLE